MLSPSLASAPNLSEMRAQLRQLVLGQEEAVDLALTAFLAGGHILLEGPPGVGKTSLAQGMATLFQGTFHRVQMTSDLLPSDIVGVLRLKPGAADFEFRPGPIFCHVLLADELNRTSAKTQAALLEAMAEQKVTVDGVSYALPNPFFVVATQNPQDFHGVYPLAESQLDRFMMHILLDLPDAQTELSLYQKHNTQLVAKEQNQPLALEDFLALQKRVRSVFIEESLLPYAQKIAAEVRKIEGVTFGASMRATLQLLDAVKARAFLQGRDFAVPEDIQTLAPALFAHRLCLRGLEIEAKQRKEMVRDAVDRVAPPV